MRQEESSSCESLDLVSNADKGDLVLAEQPPGTQQCLSSDFRPPECISSTNRTKFLLFALTCTMAFAAFDLLQTKKDKFGGDSWRKPGELRLDWEHLQAESGIAKEFAAHRHNCSKPLMWFHPCKGGLGCSLHSYAYAMCLAHRENVRLYTPKFLYTDETVLTSPNPDDLSTMNAYFHTLELQCPGDQVEARRQQNARKKERKKTHMKISSYWQNSETVNPCASILNKPEFQGVSNIDMRGASLEAMFAAGLSPTIVAEARRQHALVFGDRGVPPSSQLITVHVRWGDKKNEMFLVNIEEYIQAVFQIAAKLQLEPHETHIYLATEDPAAVQAFQEARHPEWHVYVDQFYHEMLPYRNNVTQEVAGVARDFRKGNFASQLQQLGVHEPPHVGLWAMGSLLVSLESNHFVLTSASNWSRLITELRRAVLRRTCPSGLSETGRDKQPDCTSAIDLRKAGWWTELDENGNGV